MTRHHLPPGAQMPRIPPSDHEPDDHAKRAARTYSAAADHYCLPTLAFWDRYGAATVSRLPLAPGHAVLDLCCGAGASAIPAARAVSPDGRVLGIDVAAPLLKLARTRATRDGLANVEFRRCDATRTELPSGSYDAVICVFGVFFAADMAAFMAEMWRLVRPGGTLAVTTWGPGLFEPASSLFWTAVRAIEPTLYRAFSPWDEITTPQALTGLFARGGIDGALAQAMPGEHRLECPGDFWDVVLGSGYRRTVDGLVGEQREILRERLLLALQERSITTVRTDVVFATAHRPLTS
jgi:ubiquinone/menaquinone biosynthesis C-methylase UbiE